MKRFPWISWFIALVMLFLLYFGIAYMVSTAVWGSCTLYDAAWSAWCVCTLTYWIVSNKKPKTAGVMYVDTTRDDKDIYRFEIDDMEELSSGEYLTIKIVKRKLNKTSDDVKREMGV